MAEVQSVVGLRQHKQQRFKKMVFAIMFWSSRLRVTDIDRHIFSALDPFHQAATQEVIPVCAHQTSPSEWRTLQTNRLSLLPFLSCQHRLTTTYSVHHCWPLILILLWCNSILYILHYKQCLKWKKNTVSASTPLIQLLPGKLGGLRSVPGSRSFSDIFK